LRERGSQVSLDRVLADIRASDLRDSTRGVAPLTQADDAALLDTSFLSIDAAIQRAIALVEARTAAQVATP
jgi:cytidylate kinase